MGRLNNAVPDSAGRGQAPHMERSVQVRLGAWRAENMPHAGSPPPPPRAITFQPSLKSKQMLLPALSSRGPSSDHVAVIYAESQHDLNAATENNTDYFPIPV